MKIILLQDIKGLGKKYDVKNVADGYARNFLILKNLAKPATESEIKKIEAQKAALIKQDEELKKEIAALAQKLADEDIYFYPKTGEKSEIFGSVNKNEIEKSLLKKLPLKWRKKIDIKVNLEKPLKSLGEHSVEVDLGFGVKTNVKVVLNRESIQI